jgi:hypothetical protein
VTKEQAQEFIDMQRKLVGNSGKATLSDPSLNVEKMQLVQSAITNLLLAEIVMELITNREQPL